MKILLTSGGTKVPIDRVRSITNMSRGTFGAKIARQIFLCGDPNTRLTYLGAAEFRTPFSTQINFAQEEFAPAFMRGAHLYEEYLRCQDRYFEQTYKTFEQYQVALSDLLQLGGFDVVILAAAVSDYLVANQVDGKIRSSEEWNIELEPAPKLIKIIKEICPKTHLVGFKLLVDSTKAQLIEAAKKSIVENGCSFVVANDLRDIKAGRTQAFNCVATGP